MVEGKLIETIISIFAGIFLLSLIGFLLGFALSVMSKIFKVVEDPKLEAIIDVLPGINCGACGYPGCARYADAILKNDDTPINLCSAGGKTTIDKLSLILNKNAEEKEPMVAKVFCMGDDSVALKDYEFNGEDDCLSIYNSFQGDKVCKYGCMGRGDCMRVCPVSAIKRDALNRVWIDPNICIGCEKCVAVCPTKVIKMVPLNGGHFVACSSHYDGKKVREICKKGCIACKICEKIANDTERISVIDNLAIINYTSRTDLHPAALKCPANVIIPIKTQKSFVTEILKKEFEKEKRSEKPNG